MFKARDIDWILISSTMFLMVAGIVMVYSTSYVYAFTRFGDGQVFFRKHLLWALIGLGAFAAGARLPYCWYRRLAYPCLVLAALLLMAVSLPHVGFTAGVARRWVRLGPLTFQPSEAAKLSVVIFLAYRLAAKGERIKEFAFGLLPNLVFSGVIVFLIMREPDLGSSVFVACLVVVMCVIAGARLWHLAAVAAAAAPLVWFFVVRKHEYMLGRLSAFMDPWGNAAGKGFQLIQSFIAFGSGGVTGVGLGDGKQKLLYLPEAHTDFIFSVIGEEFGLVGVGVIIALYLAILYCGVKTALAAKDSHGRYLAAGLTFMIAAQAAANMGVVLGVLPPKGLPLPFLSYGGSSLAVNMFAAGVLLNIWMKGSEAWSGPVSVPDHGPRDGAAHGH
ncbi:MAG: putative lipid II flippase FtsW [Deltaproteobacteria bacterium]|nr:putative lipid II flippase FtsW [Deltaproteobacteria bacterium]